MCRSPIATPFTEAEYREFVECVQDSWEASRYADQQHDIVIDHPEGRQIRIDSAHRRISCLYRPEDHWGIRERKVDDLQEAAEILMTSGMFVDMTQLRLLGLGGHPEKPDSLIE
jgi:hypothetical protein